MVAIYYLADNLRIILNGATENLLSMRVRGNGDSSIPVAGSMKSGKNTKIGCFCLISFCKILIKKV
jgi:hypothetical protein